MYAIKDVIAPHQNPPIINPMYKEQHLRHPKAKDIILYRKIFTSPLEGLISSINQPIGSNLTIKCANIKL